MAKSEIISLIANVLFGIVTGFTFAEIFRDSGWSLGFVMVLAIVFGISLKLMIAFDYRSKS